MFAHENVCCHLRAIDAAHVLVLVLVLVLTFGGTVQQTEHNMLRRYDSHAKSHFIYLSLLPSGCDGTTLGGAAALDDAVAPSNGIDWKSLGLAP